MAGSLEFEMDVVVEACRALAASGPPAAAEIIAHKLPFSPTAPVKRQATRLEMLKAFVRDGFIDRYAGSRLIFPRVFRVMSLRMPDAFPFHKNWKTDACHPAYWSLMPTLDHFIPVARRGADSLDNWVTTSQLRNSIKAHWSVEELGWQLHPPGDGSWDGMMAWCLDFVAREPDLAEEPYIRDWVRAARRLEARPST